MHYVSFISALTGGTTLYIIYCLTRLFGNYCRAQQSGFPIYVTLVDPQHPLWILSAEYLRPYFSRFLPAFLNDRLQVATFGWEHRARFSLNEKLGSTFMLVTSGKNGLMIADPEIALNVLIHRKDYMQPDLQTRILLRHGPSLITADGGDWQRQRRLIAPLLNERISDQVWRESTKQAKEMLEHLAQDLTDDSENPKRVPMPGETDATIQGLRDIAINVLLSAGYGLSQPWKKRSTEEPPPGHTLTYIESIVILVKSFIAATFIPQWILCLPVMPASLQRVGNAITEFPQYTEEILEKERRSPGHSQSNLLSVLVNTSDAEKNDPRKNASSKLHLSEHELRGNLFIFTIAGFESTANTLAYAVAHLAAYPSWQQWIIEEIDQVVSTHAEDSYEKIFPVLKRCLALMFETLRLYTPASQISRNSPVTQKIVTPSRTYIVPANTSILINAASLHVHPEFWGPDRLTFRPSRWLTDEGSLMEPPKGTFLAWSEGPRSCPGMKMSQVEFVAVLFRIFRTWKVEPAVKERETVEMARERVKEVIKQSQQGIALQMVDPRALVLKWSVRV